MLYVQQEKHNIKALKLVLDQGRLLKEEHSVIEFNQEAKLKSNIYVNTELGTKVKNDL